ncbi:hypothetical protein ACHAXT_012956 [Thalassiosira profunda]
MATDRARSAADYESELSLRAALTEPPFFDHDPQPVAATDLPVKCTFNAQLFGKKVGLGCCDWQTATLDLASSHPQSVEEEVKRLMELKEYSILDAEHEEKFERITALASRIFDVPICLVSLVDIGRQWFMSNRGLGEVRETSREVSFCAHAILSKQDVFIVPDTYEDPRFKDNGLVTGPPFIRFYAGVPLVSPNGYKLGTFCIIDRKPRPNGLSLTDKQNLRELTDMVMDTMVHRKQEMERVMDEKTRLIACAAHDLLSPLTGIRLNLGLLMEDEGLQKRLDANQRELMEASVQCSNVIERICVGAIESFRGERPTSPSAVGKEKGEVAVAELVENIDRVMGTYPKKVPFFIEKDDNVPPAFISDDLKLFRSVMNYLTNACKNAKAGSIKLRIYVRKANDEATPIELDLLPGALVAPKDDVLVIEVHDAGPGIALEKYPTLFTQVDQSGNGANDRASRRKKARTGLGLYSVATEISSLGGEYGVFPRQDLVASHPDLDDADNGPSVSGCVFWLSVPLVLPAAASPTTSPEKKEASPEQTVKVEDLKLMPAPIPKKRPADTVDEGEGASSEPAKKEAKVEINASAGEITEPLASEPEPSKRAKRVLIIDDSLTIRKALSRGFSRLDFEVDEAENGLQGFKKLKSGLYEIVVLDFLMPVMDGPEVARKIRAWELEHRPDFHQYIVGISAHANGKDAELGIKAGMDRFMSKPVPLKSLKDLAQSKPVMEASAAIDVKLRRSSEDIEAVSKIAEEKSDEEQSRSSRSSTTTSTFTKHSALLAVEDQPTLHSLQRIVEKYGWRAVVVSNGEDALRLLKLRKWDAAIIDNDLPVFSGTNCLIRFRDWETHSRAVRQKNIFILSDSYSPTSAPSGFDGALGKPLEPKQILSTLEAAGKNTLTPSIVALRSSFTSH